MKKYIEKRPELEEIINQERRLERKAIERSYER